MTPSRAPEGRPPSLFSTLRRLARPRVPEEHCELCAKALAPEHRHMLEVASRKVVCSCDPCALSFQNVVGGRFKLIPRDARSLTDFQLSDAEWESLALPIDLAFFFHSEAANQTVALYPSPAGATESLLPLTAWQSIVAGNPLLGGMRADVEALLVDRVKDKREYFIAPIDACFELVGLIRLHWRGLSGGEDVWKEIDAFFDRLKERARPANPVSPKAGSVIPPSEKLHADA